MTLNEDEQHAVLIENAIGVNIREEQSKNLDEIQETENDGLGYGDLQQKMIDHKINFSTFIFQHYFFIFCIHRFSRIRKKRSSPN